MICYVNKNRATIRKFRGAAVSPARHNEAWNESKGAAFHFAEVRA